MAEEKIIMKRGNSIMCQVKGCNGEPKDLKQAEIFNGTICTKCFCVYEYEAKSLKIPKVDKKEKQRIAYREALENGLETENEKSIAKTMKEKCKPKSKVYEKKKPKLMQQDAFGGESEIKKKVREIKSKKNIINLGLKK